MHNTHTTLPSDSDVTLAYLPSRVYLKASDNAEEVITALEQQHTLLLEAWGARERERIFQRATRYTDDDPRPEFPLIVRSHGRAQAPRFALMPNGQRVLWVGARRVQTLCGLHQTLDLTDAIAQCKLAGGRDRCPSCEGHHLARRQTATVPAAPAATPLLECPRCHADANATYIPEGPDTLKCLSCGHRIYQSGPVRAPEPGLLDHTEIEQNETAIHEALFLSADEAEGEEDEELTASECDPTELNEDSMEYASSHEIEPDTFEDITGDESDLRDVIDRLHEPAFHLFTKGHTPLRQSLVELMLQGREQDENKTLHWVLAGQLSREGLDMVPTTNGDGTRESIADWLNSLSTDDLLILVGNPDTEHPILSHPSLHHFLSLDPLTHPLEKALYYQLRGFRDKAAGSQILGQRHHLKADVLEGFITRMGRTIPSIQHTNRYETYSEDSCLTPITASGDPLAPGQEAETAVLLTESLPSR